jgi:thymidylate kinase
MTVCRALGFTVTHRLPKKVMCSEHQYYRNKAIASIWPWVQFLDVNIFTIFLVYVALLRKFTVVCDRFVYDTLVEMMADVNDNKLHQKLVGRLILKLKPRATIAFFLDIEEKTAFQRRQDIPNLRYLTFRRNSYRTLSRDLDIVKVDAELPFYHVHKDIVGKIGRVNLE